MKYGTPYGRATVMAAALAAAFGGGGIKAQDVEGLPKISSARNGRKPGAQMANIRKAKKARAKRLHRARSRA